MAQLCLLTSLVIILPGVFSAATFTFINKCDHTVWPGILSNAGISALPTTGFSLRKGESKSINAPSSWGGRFWGRTHCTEDSAGKFTCVTGDCGSGKLECAGGGAAPPATLAEFTLDGAGGMDFFDVSLVDGYNLPMVVVPQGGTGPNCTNTGCLVDLNGPCPSQLKVTSTDGEGVACKSACEEFGKAEYCCSGAYGTPDTCKPSSYSLVFKKNCPRAYSYAYDDQTSTFTCAGSADYLISFCPGPSTSQKSSSGAQTPATPEFNSTMVSGAQTPATPEFNSTMVYEGAMDVSSASSRPTCMHVFRPQAVAGAVAIVAALWWWCQLF
ncbi:hypothetical protein RJ639_017317 [Escallonia herrerae]|uniref:Thaumatin-like protein 1 n=1 Tax=Escallonia herrerae TaxID=1293975 RepID=A0AA89AKP7_9ASTE|nr:hypothetical protein RJ639_017317 [Escallonia herrerae]